MRRRLNLMTVGVTLLVVVAFVIPLALLVRRQADERARLEAETTAQTLAAVVVRATAGADPDLDLGDLEGLIGPIPEGSAIVLPSGDAIGPADPDPWLVAEVETARAALSAYNVDGFGVAVPIGTPAGTAIVYSSVPEEALVRGVGRAWGLLGLLGAGLVGAALMLSDRLGRSVVGPSRRIATAAEALGEGDLDVRVAEEGPEELQAIAQSFNRLGRRIRGLLETEREQVADLSHRLRTPLSALRLHVEQLDAPERDQLLERVDRVVGAVDDLIDEARSSPSERANEIDIVGVVEARARFWEILAHEQGRAFHVELPRGPAHVEVGEKEASAALDSLIGNVFAHTEAGVGFGVVASLGEDHVEIVVADSGPGFPEGFDPLERGLSGAGSSGLGLDIARRFAVDAGGDLRVGSSHSGGARLVITVPLATSAKREGPSS